MLTSLFAVVAGTAAKHAAAVHSTKVNATAAMVPKSIVAAPMKPLPANAQQTGSGKIDLPSDFNTQSLLFGVKNSTENQKHCDESSVSTAAAWSHSLAAGCDIDWKTGRELSLSRDATVHVPITELKSFANQLHTMPPKGRVTLVVTGGDAKKAVPFPPGLLADARLVRVFRAIPNTDSEFGATQAEKQEFSEEKMSLIRIAPAVASSSMSLMASNTSHNATAYAHAMNQNHLRAAVACTELLKSLERVWAAHEQALLTEDPEGHKLAQYYNNTGWQREVPGVGPYHYYHYYNEGGYSQEYCEPMTVIYPDGRKQIKYQCYQVYYGNYGGNVFLFFIYLLLFFLMIYCLLECGVRQYKRQYYGYEEPPSKSDRF